MNAPVYRPKRLAWGKDIDGHYVAKTILGGSTIRPPSEDGYWRVWDYNFRHLQRCESLEAAQAAAQAWYDARMIQGLEEVTTEREVRDE